MKIYYVHHALRATGNPPSQNDGITPLGKKDANIVAKIFKDKKKNTNFVSIYTSPYFRCKKTAEIINKYINVPIIEDERLNEYEDIFQALKYGKDTKTAESWVDCQKRIISFIKEIVDTHNEKDTVICVTSGVNISAFINLAYRIKPNSDAPFPLVPSCSPIAFDIDKSHFENL